jgi:hypothetical protein
MLPQPKPQRERDSDYTAFVKSKPCLIASKHTCAGPLDPHHVIPAGGGKTGSKVSDRRQVPLCRAAHDLAKRRDWFQEHFALIFDYEIAMLNREYDALPKTPKRERERTTAVLKYSLFSCACGFTHRITPTRAEYTATTAEYVITRSPMVFKLKRNAVQYLSDLLSVVRKFTLTPKRKSKELDYPRRRKS